MPALLCLRERVAQPQQEPELNRANSLTHGLAFSASLHPMWGVWDSIGNKIGTRTQTGNSELHRANRDGLFPYFGASNYVDFTNPIGIDGTTPITIAWSQEPQATSLYSTVLNWKPTGATNTFVIYCSSSDSSYYFTCGPRTANGGIQFSAVGAVANNVIHHYVLQIIGGTDSTTPSNYVLWRNGTKITSSTNITYGENSTDSFRFGALETGSDPFEGLLGNLNIWSRVLSNAEAISWSENPYQIYEDELDLSWIPSSSAIIGARSHRMPHIARM